MTREQVKEILDRVLSWPSARQADVARIVKVMEAQDKSPLRPPSVARNAWGRGKNVCSAPFLDSITVMVGDFFGVNGRWL
jgi:hypothetical protein